METAHRMVLATWRRPFKPGLVSRNCCRSANSTGGTSRIRRNLCDLVQIGCDLAPFPMMRFGLDLRGCDPALVPLPPDRSGSVWVNQGFWAGALARVRSQMWRWAASAFISSIAARAFSARGARAAGGAVAVLAWMFMRDLLRCGKRTCVARRLACGMARDNRCGRLRRATGRCLDMAGVRKLAI